MTGSTSSQNNPLNSSDTAVLFEELRLVRIELEALKAMVSSDKRKEKLFGDWIHESDLMSLTGYSRSGLYALWKKGIITKSSISGKANYYRMSDFKKLLDRNEYQ